MSRAYVVLQPMVDGDTARGGLVRLRSAARRVVSRRSAAVPGSIERAHNGLVSGWLYCPACAGSEHAEVTIQGRAIRGTVTPTPRPDVPGGLGVLVRFAPQDDAESRVDVRLGCRVHPDRAVHATVAPTDWSIPALGRIEHVAWPHVSGWIAEFASGSETEPLAIEVQGLGLAPLQVGVTRADVEAFLGQRGVGGFQIDLGDSLGYAAPEGTPIRLFRGKWALDSAQVMKSPITHHDSSCLPTKASVGQGAEELGTLGARLTHESGPVDGADWISNLEGLGIQDSSATTRQWAELLRHDYGLSSRQIAALLARRAVGGLRVPVLDPLPGDLAVSTASLTPQLPERIAQWNAGVVQTVLSEALTAGESQPRRDPQRMGSRVCVAGLVNHPSGLGQNAAHSITALSASDLHVCTAPFFPAPGGWNPGLGTAPEALNALEDHTVLLHLPIDRVVQSFCAQPALLSSPRVIGYFMWETALVPRQMHRALDLVDEIWTATEFVAEAFRRVSSTPVHVTGHAVDVSRMESIGREQLGIPDDAFVVHFSFDANSTVARKNPSAALDAFHHAFDGDPSAVFVLKVRNMQQAEHLARSGDPHARGLLDRLRDDPSIRLLAGEWSYGRSLGLIDMADCLISLHRSEGYGYSIAEAMALGTPVVATGYSGSDDLLTDATGWRVPYELTGVMPEEYFYWEPGMAWAEPDIQAAAGMLREVRAGDGVGTRVSAARSHVSATATIRALRQRYLSGLRA